MLKRSWICTIPIIAAVGAVSLCAQEAERPIGNGDILNMIQAGLPETTILSQIEILAGRGATFDITPAAMIELNRRGASEAVLNRIIWAQMEVVPSVSIAVPRGVFYKAGTNVTPLNSFLFWADFSPRWSTWPFYAPGARTVAQGASPSVVQVSGGSPTLVVQGYSSDAGWQLVKMERASDYRQMRLKRKHGYGKDFFSDSVFERSDLRPVSFAPEGAHSFSVRPTASLEPGAYALCGQLDSGWMRACYEFQVSGSMQ